MKILLELLPVSIGLKIILVKLGLQLKIVTVTGMSQKLPQLPLTPIMAKVDSPIILPDTEFFENKTSDLFKNFQYIKYKFIVIYFEIS